MDPSLPDDERCYRAVASRDGRFDGWFVVGVTSTGIYCRPSCPAPVRPKRDNCRFFPTAAAAQGARFRACKRCRPDAIPGSPQWDLRSDLVGRAMRAIADGEIDRRGVAGLARSLGVSQRHLGRVLDEVVGAGPLAIARARRAQMARTLIETTDLAFAEIAFAAGFGSVRQFNDTIRAVFDTAPSGLRRQAGRPLPDRLDPGPVAIRLPVRQPFDATALVRFVALHTVPGIEEIVHGVIRRSLRLPHGEGVVELEPHEDHVACRMRLDDLRDLATAVQRCRRWLDLDADPIAINHDLSHDPILGPMVRRRPGLRVPGTVDGVEHAVRTIVGQQVSLRGAATVVGRITAAASSPLRRPVGGVTVLPAGAVELLAHDGAWPLPAARRRAVIALCEAVVAGQLDLSPGADRTETRRRLRALPGVGPWTAELIAMRALGDPDAFPASDLVLRRAAVDAGLGDDPRRLTERAKSWRPWRAYATHHLWATVIDRSAEEAA